MALPRRLVDLRPGEAGGFLRAFGVLALTIAGHTLLETARDALFLARLPPRSLTYVYVVVAAGAFLVTPLSARLARSTGVRSAFVVSLLFAAFGAAWFRLRAPNASAVFGLYVFGTLSATVLVAQFWSLAATLFSASQSRRLFGVLAAGGVLGAVLAAALAALVLGFMEVRALLAFSSVAYFGAALLATTIETEPLDEANPAPASQTSARMPGQLGRMRRDPLVWRLAAITVLSTVASVLIDYLFKGRVSGAMPSQDLAPFFARYQLVLNLVSLFLQLTVIGPLVERLGVVSLALITPAALMLGGATTFLSAAALPVTVVFKALDAALRNSVGRVSLELFWAPVENQTRLRGLIDAVLSRGAQAASGAALLALSMSGVLSNLALAGAATLIAVAWLGVGFGARIPYIELFRRAIGRGQLEREIALAELDLTAVETVVEALARPEAGEVIAAMNVLAERGRTRLIPALILYHHDADVLVRALELFGSSPRKDWLGLGERLLTHRDPRVPNAAVRAFALSSADAQLERAAQHENPSVRGFAALYLAQRQGRSMQGDPLEWALFADDDPLLHPLKRAFIEALGKNPTIGAPALLLTFARLPALRGAVTQALVETADESCIPYLISRLAAVDERLNARSALVRLGSVAFVELTKALRDPALERRVRIHVPRTLSAFANDAAVTELLLLLRGSEDGLVRYKALRGLEQIARTTSLRIATDPILQEIDKNASEYLRLFALCRPLTHEGAIYGRVELLLVQELLDDKLHQSLERLVRLVQIAHRSDDIPALFAALKAPDRRQRSRAVEFLDALIRSLSRASDEVASLLRLVVDDLPAEERVRRAAPRIGEIQTLDAALERLLQDSDPVLRELAERARDGLLQDGVTLGQGPALGSVA